MTSIPKEPFCESRMFSTTRGLPLMPTQSDRNQRRTLFALVGQQHDLVAAAKEKLGQQRQELLHLASALQAGWEATRSASRTKISELRLENRSLKNLVESLHEREQRDRQARETTFRLEIDTLQGQLREKEEILARLKAAPQTAPSSTNGILSGEREQLEYDRRLLEGELEKAKAAARQAELEISRERAHLARERIELMRIKEEIRHELERAQRSAEVEQRLAPVQRLQDELIERHRQVGPSMDTPLPLQRTKGTETRWHTLLKKLDETTS
jgi:hypothetical protein